MPDEPRGPGSQGQSGLRLTQPTSVAVTARDREARLEVQALGEKSLESIRAVAGNWQKGMAGLVALTTATLLFKGADTIRDYETWVAWTMGLLVFASLGCGVVSLVLFLRAMHGTGRVVTNEQVQDAGGPLGLRLRMAVESAKDLKTARNTAIGAVVALALAIGLSWYGPTTENDPPAFVKITYRTQEGEVARCGVLKAADGTNVVLQVKGEPQPRSIATRDLLGMVIASGC